MVRECRAGNDVSNVELKLAVGAVTISSFYIKAGSGQVLLPIVPSMNFRMPSLSTNYISSV